MIESIHTLERKKKKGQKVTVEMLDDFLIPFFVQAARKKYQKDLQ